MNILEKQVTIDNIIDINLIPHVECHQSRDWRLDF